jgi:hypothetical protein
MTTKQSRIVLDEDVREIIDRIQIVTKSPSPSHAIALLTSRYGEHLIQTWKHPIQSTTSRSLESHESY